MSVVSNQGRKPFQCKKAVKGIQSLRGQPELYDQKKSRFYFKLTETTAEELNHIAEEFDISRSELVERISRKLIKLKFKRGQKVFDYSSQPTQIRCLALTEYAAQLLEKIARKRNLSSEQFLEQIGHGLILVDR